jgi:DMSO/TMAO reductase YedYZ molybdopterin-dependent catalytic subunit
MRRPEYPGLIVRQKSPLNLEYQFSSLGDWLTPSDQFYVRSHFPTPMVEGESWSLVVDGAVERPLRLGLADLHAMKAAKITAVMECAGNGRVFYEPAREGLQWQSGAVGNAAWDGILLRDILGLAGLRPDAVEVVLVGADRGPVDAGKKTASPGPIAFARSLPLDKALSDGVLLATEMNGETLTPAHGFPLRAVVGGWFGMAWVKWVQEIRVVERPFLGYWQARDYFRWERRFGEPILVPLAEMEVKAQIAQPVNGATLTAGQPVRIFGAAWSGEEAVARVEVSTDGATWRQARLLQPDQPYAWRMFEHVWTPPSVGSYSLRARAVDTAGNVQPEGQQPDRESYVVNWVVPVEVRAVASSEPYREEFVI